MKRIYEAGKCSICGSENISYGSTKLDGHSMGYEITCDDCGASGYEWYNLQYVETTMEKEK